MKKKPFLIIIVVIVLVLSGIFIYQRTSRNTVVTNKDYPTTQNFNFYSINDIKQKSLASGTYNTEGYVVKQYECPFCPQETQCKPCMRDNIVISENNKLLDTYILTNNEIVVFANNPKQFELGKKYSFSVKILDHKSTDEPINDIELVGYQ
ncbi:MAG: hypothetical protein UT39_C0002G0009 [Candidatus Woesebacteria bacterium GW2011_GWA1_39_21]|uniref:Uncharacterized protein n=1 Tax=Candidatus Woesebacteria bacterium GW2011_GWA1_39_21 TaxID=1618550 RepID=A0A0G0N8Q5_9BACT|nr:MAG: hypothetical protein UT39_C0002G0009 [Candidatus Woesebacteria bacterium GW2011_GWA1_39_21]